ncbi:ribosomal protein L28e, partial [Jaminaea rosea]
SQDLQWLLTRQSSSFIVKQKGLGKVFSREPNNLAAIHSYTYSGIVNDKSVGIEAAPKGRGVVVSTRKTKSAPNQVANTRSEYVVKKGGSRRAAGKVANIVAKNGYRPDLRKAAVARASMIMRSQRSRKAPYARKARG